MENLTQEEFYYSIITIRESLKELVEAVRVLNETVSELKEKVDNKTACAEKVDKAEISETGKKVAKEIMDMLGDAEKAESKSEQPKKSTTKKTPKKTDSSSETKEVSRKKKVRLDEEVK